jgi:hypothetical protein
MGRLESKVAALIQHLFTKMMEKDKLQHMRWSFVLVLISNWWWPLAWATIAVFVVGLAKEIWDARYGSGFCFYDLLGNLIGIGLGCLAMMVMG